MSVKISPGNTLSGLRYEHSSRRSTPRALEPGVAGSSFRAGFSGGNLGIIADESSAGKQEQEADPPGRHSGAAHGVPDLYRLGSFYPLGFSFIQLAGIIAL